MDGVIGIVVVVVVVGAIATEVVVLHVVFVDDVAVDVS